MMMSVSHRKMRLGNGRGIFATVVVQMQGGDHQPLGQSARGKRWFVDILKIWYFKFILVETTWERVELEAYIFFHMVGA